MKKLLSLVVAAGMLIGSAVGASAADIKVKGKFDFGFGLYDGTNFTKSDNEEAFDALQRFRTQIDFIASESLKGVAAFEIGNTHWGSGGGATWGGNDAGSGAGGAMGADGVSVEVKHLYIDWLLPQTDLQIRMGVQPFALPRAAMRSDGEDGGYVLDDDMAGVLLSYNFNENFGANLGWFRPWDGQVNDQSDRGSNRSSLGTDVSGDEIDVFLLTLPIEMKNAFSFTPYVTYALIGDNLNPMFDPLDPTSGNGFSPSSNIGGFGNVNSWLSANGDLGNDGSAMWAGFAFDFSYLDPFVAALDFTYGSYRADSTGGGTVSTTRNSPDRDGWVAVAKLGYKLDFFTPIMFGWYGSGTDNLRENGTDGIMPYLSPDWGLTSFGWSNAHFGGREYLVGATPAGTWAIGLGLEDIKFIDGLTSHLRVMYFEGTNDINGSLREDAFLNNGIFGSDDSGVEVNLDNVYSIYENLDMFVELGYMNINLDREPASFEDDAWKGYVGFTYSF